MSFQSRIAPVETFATQSAPRHSLMRRMVFAMLLWRQRVRIRRSLAQMDARSLREAGISPAAAAFESGKPFWREMGDLR